MPEKNLETLLSSMNPHLHSNEFVFCSASEHELRSLDITPLCLFREDEAVSLIVEKCAADRVSLSTRACGHLLHARSTQTSRL